MEYAVIYYSESGNTEMLAEQIYEVIDSSHKILIDLDKTQQIPSANVYFVGFPIHQKNCSLKVVDALEQIETGKLVLFATCGLTPTGAYRQKLEEALSLWISEETDYLGMFLCQGKTREEQKENFYRMNPEYREKMEDMLQQGDSHPNRDDIEDVIHYVKRFL
jgi:flavodoxin